MIKKFIYKNKVYAEIIRAKAKSDRTRFFQMPSHHFNLDCSSQKGYTENPHYHRKIKRIINDCQQVLFVQKGKIQVKFFDSKKKLIKSILIKKGDSINILQGIHLIKVLQDSQCITVKQGPFISDKMDKVDV